MCDVVRPLGKKSMGSVWMHRFGARDTAVKWISLADDPAASLHGICAGGGYSKAQKLAMLLREVAALHQLNHPHIVALLGITVVDRLGHELRAALTQPLSHLQAQVRADLHLCTE